MQFYYYKVLSYFFMLMISFICRGFKHKPAINGGKNGCLRLDCLLLGIKKTFHKRVSFCLCIPDVWSE